jgi:Zn-dependent peptidase ImmA (M78 family)
MFPMEMTPMNLSLYKTNDLENWIAYTYQKNKIHYAADLDIDRIAGMFNASIIYHPGQTKIIWNDKFGLIYIDESLDERQRRERFFHEVAHIVRHTGYQVGMNSLFVQLQEIQAALFQFYAAMPVFMLEPYCHIQNQNEYISTLSNDFRLPITLIQKRLRQVRGRIEQTEKDRAWRERDTDVSHINDDYIQNLQAELGKRRAEMLRGRD